MFCEKCGRKEKEKSTFDCIEEKLLNVEIKNIQKKRKLFYWWIRYCTLLFVVSFSIFLITGCSEENKNETEVIEKLRSITRLENDEECYVFSNNVEDTEALEWELRYTEENEAVRFEEKAIVESIDNYFGEECVEKDGFVYDLSENEVRIYLETEVQEGILTIINYIIDEDETTVMIDGKRYSAADNIVDIMEEKNLVNIMKDDIDKFKQQLEKNSISFEEILDLKYEDIVKYIKNKKEEIPVFEENEETNREEKAAKEKKKAEEEEKAAKEKNNTENVKIQEIDLSQYTDSFVYPLVGDGWQYVRDNNIEIFNFLERKRVLEFTSQENLEAISEQKVYVEENTGFFSDIPSYKRTLDETEFIYIGGLNGENMPEGLGILMEFDDYNQMAWVKYAGYFKEGTFDGYGMKSESINGYLDGIGFYEGYFKKGVKCGEGIEMNQLLETPDKYYLVVGEFADDMWNGMIKEYKGGKLLYEGEAKYGGYYGKGTQYHYETGKIIYQGEFKNSEYNGQGTLYDENGNIKYQGKFENGDIG